MEAGRLNKKGRLSKVEGRSTNSSLQKIQSGGGIQHYKIHKNKFEQSILCEFNECELVFVTEKFPLFYAAYIYTNLLKSSRSFTYHQVEHSLILSAAHRMYLCVLLGISEQRATFVLYKKLVFIAERQNISCTVGTGSLKQISF